jgi:nucleotide-binding universal stress UspA family protein
MGIKKVLVPTDGSGDDELIKLACSLAKGFKAKIYVVYIIEVERNLPLETEVDSETEKAEKILTRDEDIADEAGYEVETDLLQARDAGPGIVAEAVERGVDLIMMSTSYEKPRGVVDIGKAVQYVLKEAPCQVLLYREPVS